jgi:hypothetical protein
LRQRRASVATARRLPYTHNNSSSNEGRAFPIYLLYSARVLGRLVIVNAVDISGPGICGCCCCWPVHILNPKAIDTHTCVYVSIYEKCYQRGCGRSPLNPSCYCLCCWTHLLWTASDRLLMATTFPITNFPPQSSHCCWYVTPAHSFMSFYTLTHRYWVVLYCVHPFHVFLQCHKSCWIYSSSYLFAPVNIICRNSECVLPISGPHSLLRKLTTKPFCRFYRYYLVVFFFSLFKLEL